VNDGTAAFADLAAFSDFLTVATAVRSSDVADRWRSRNERGVADTDDDFETGEAENPASEPSSTKTELPQWVQNERLGSVRRRHDPQIIGRCYANFCHIQDFLPDDGLVRPAPPCDPR
jgi:hypothetical protein